MEDMRALNVTPHVAQNTTSRRSAIDGRTTRHAGYETSQQKRTGRGAVRLGQDDRRAGASHVARHQELDFKFIWTMAAYELIKLPRLIGAAA
jgi:hypothetical protein